MGPARFIDGRGRYPQQAIVTPARVRTAWGVWWVKRPR
jgi:hypothetical protein